VDVRCTDESGKQYIVEMQVVTQKDFTERAQYYTACGIAHQLSSREEYYKLLPVIFIGVLDFSLFESNQYVSHHRTLNIENNNWEFKLSEYHIIELPKFTKEVTEESAFLDKWIYFLKYATTLEEVPQTLNNPILNEAFEVLATSNLTQEESIAYNEYLDDIRCASSQIATAKEIGKAEGLAEGIVAGKAEGEKLKAIAIAQNLLDILDPKTIAQKTGLSIEDVEALKHK
jgi:predicted transposase/invertase (TIGR01784 family)